MRTESTTTWSSPTKPRMSSFATPPPLPRPCPLAKRPSVPSCTPARRPWEPEARMPAFKAIDMANRSKRIGLQDPILRSVRNTSSCQKRNRWTSWVEYLRYLNYDVYRPYPYRPRIHLIGGFCLVVPGEAVAGLPRFHSFWKGLMHPQFTGRTVPMAPGTEPKWCINAPKSGIRRGACEQSCLIRSDLCKAAQAVLLREITTGTETKQQDTYGQVGLFHFEPIKEPLTVVSTTSRLWASGRTARNNNQ
ncbi:hypothetical protein LX36DRAFT_249165 [Colletotrichum falcatum]|nr:hypothetical protein LX36DRAFT_249165 [Colletotrichum falcatum]